MHIYIFASTLKTFFFVIFNLSCGWLGWRAAWTARMWSIGRYSSSPGGRMKVWSYKRTQIISYCTKKNPFKNSPFIKGSMSLLREHPHSAIDRTAVGARSGVHVSSLDYVDGWRKNGCAKSWNKTLIIRYTAFVKALFWITNLLSQQKRNGMEYCLSWDYTGGCFPWWCRSTQFLRRWQLRCGQHWGTCLKQDFAI